MMSDDILNIYCRQYLHIVYVNIFFLFIFAFTSHKLQYDQIYQSYKEQIN